VIYLVIAVSREPLRMIFDLDVIIVAIHRAKYSDMYGTGNCEERRRRFGS
jgi:hypothetical protein